MRRSDRYDDDWNEQDDWDEDDGWEKGRRKWPFVLLVAVVLGAVLVGPRVLSRFDSDTARGVEVPTTARPTGSSSTPTSTSSVTSATAATTAVSVSGAADPPVELVALQTVPAVRDLIVVINGQDVASDGTGLIPLARNQRHGTIEFVGLVSTPPLLQVELVAWSDGETEATRSLDTLPGPVAQIGLVVSARVHVTLDDPSVVADQVEFSSEAGDVDVNLDALQWLPARRAIQATDGFVEQTLTYVSQWTIGATGPETRLPYEEFRVTPETLWVVRTQ